MEKFENDPEDKFSSAASRQAVNDIRACRKKADAKKSEELRRKQQIAEDVSNVVDADHSVVDADHSVLNFYPALAEAIAESRARLRRHTQKMHEENQALFEQLKRQNS